MSENGVAIRSHHQVVMLMTTANKFIRLEKIGSTVKLVYNVVISMRNKKQFKVYENLKRYSFG